MIFKQISYNSDKWREAVRLREDILRKPLGSRFSAEELNEEKEHVQIAGFLEGKLIATAVLVKEGDRIKVQRVVVSDSYRNNEIGTQMMVFCEGFARKDGFKEMYCHARDTAVNFYVKNNYLKIGDYFNEDGIPHLRMEKHL